MTEFIFSNFTEVSSSTHVISIQSVSRKKLRLSKTSLPTMDSEVITSTNDPLKKSSPRRKGVRYKKWKSDEPHPILSIPIELFINICYFCHPQTLISLSKVNKQFAIYLNESKSPISTKIWADSRKGFLPNLRLGPPEGMTEKAYCTLSVGRGCMVCGKPKIRKVYWAFNVRCCLSCLDKITIRDYIIEGEMGIPSCVLLGLPYLEQQKWTRLRGSFSIKIYLSKQVKDALKEYKKLPVKERRDWCRRMEIQGLAIMDEINQRMNNDSLKRGVYLVEGQ